MRKLMLGMMLVAGGLAPPAADADNFSWYVGFSGGRSHASGSSDFLAVQLRRDGHAIPNSNVSFDKDDRSAKLFVGVEFMPYLGAEVGYAEFGDIGVNVTGTSTNAQAFFASLANNQPIGAEGPYVDLVGRYPILDNLFVFARLGQVVWSSEVQYSAPGVNVAADRGGIDAHWGGGIRWDLAEKFSATVEYERFDADTHVEAISLGFRLNFH